MKTYQENRKRLVELFKIVKKRNINPVRNHKWVDFNDGTNTKIRISELPAYIEYLEDQLPNQVKKFK